MASRTSISGCTFDCSNPERLARFWAQLLGFELADSSEDGALIAQGPNRETWIWFQKVAEPKVSKNRFHLDLETDDLEGEVARAEGLGATRLADHDAKSWTWKVLQDPEGNEFCLGTAVPRPEG